MNTREPGGMGEIAEKIRECRRCRLWKHRKNPVVGEGPVPARGMMIGEAPGRTEDEQGRPFVGRAGRLLDKLLSEVGVDRRELYITNVVKCRPPGNRPPLLAEVRACVPYLSLQILIVNPRAILLLGRTPATFLIGNKLPLIRTHEKRRLEELRGERHYLEVHGRKFVSIVTYHPAAVLRNPRLERKIIEDLMHFKKLLY